MLEQSASLVELERIRVPTALKVVEKTPPLIMERFPSYNLAGAKITPATREELNVILKTYIDERRQCVIVSQNMHGLHVRRSDPSFFRLERMPHTYVHIDGMPIVLLCKLVGIDVSRAHRVTLVDWIWPMLTLAEREGWRVYYLGGKEDVLERGLAEVRRRLPELDIRGHHGYFAEDAETFDTELGLLREFESFRPHLVLVGMGMGRQERWILKNLGAVAPACVCTVGACMEYIAGTVRTPPRWMGKAGIEWLFRLLENPGRFWRRYLIEPWPVLVHFARRARWRH
jgi:N-acetylglucosaminyldiphosphoundecaprenol N-acetyl-beta-D-mannosaminyltransferase